VILALLLGILVGSYALLALFARGLEPLLRGRISLALLFAFTGVGHFVKTEPMVQMLPEWVPLRTELVVATGVLELLGALGLLVPATSRAAGLCLLAFLVLVFPANVYAAWNEVPMGGHEAGLVYLWIRGPLQVLLIGWTYVFAVRTRAPARRS
jgi:uncharacterized membrane protein